jgi:hypothetical protein
LELAFVQVRLPAEIRDCNLELSLLIRNDCRRILRVISVWVCVSGPAFPSQGLKPDVFSILYGPTKVVP